ncbi:hypothetical protein HY448_02085 [Candidatus Pacearchaeota archaeon]|nr:hypothetical protein [Candidatus Pacearchaeota archaeon]
MDKQRDELDEIFVDRNEPADKKIIVEILKPLVTIDGEGIINFTEKYEKLAENRRALVYFVCKKAISLRKGSNETEPIGPTELSRGARISENSAKHAIFRDYKRILVKEGSGYIIPNYKLNMVKELLQYETNISK